MSSFAIIRLIAAREFNTRFKDRTFIISTVIIVGVLLVVVLLPTFLGGTDNYTLVYAGEDAARIVSTAEQLADSDDLLLSTRSASSEEAARTQLRDAAEGATVADVALVDGDDGPVLVSMEPPPSNLESLLQTATQQSALVRSLNEAGLSSGQIDEILASQRLRTETLAGGDVDEAASQLAFAGTLLLYGLLLSYGYWVASGVVEEKSSRVVEILLAGVRPRQLLTGKVVGIGALALVQLSLIVAVALSAGLLTGAFTLPEQTANIVGGLLGWFVLGYAFYSCAFAVAGSLVSRQEDVQNTSTPLTLLIMGGFFVSVAVIENPSGSLAQVSSFIPPIAPLIMPARIASGVVGAWTLMGSALATLAGAALLIMLGARLYEGSILATGGRISLREAWRSRDTEPAESELS